MQLPNVSELLLHQSNGVLHITLNRPHKRNAMNSQLVSELEMVLDAIATAPLRESIRVIVISGADGNFCAGGDISGMNQEPRTDASGHDASWHFNRAFGRLIAKLNRTPQLVITCLEGAVLGGGFGMACVSDLAIADEDALLAMPETGLGIIPAQIAPFVVARIGITQARRLALFGRRINGREALEIGLVHEVTTGAQEMRAALDAALKLAQKVAPQATAVTKQLLLDAQETLVMDSLLDRAADDFSAAIVSAEGREGTKAFLEKRAPRWAREES